MDSSTSAHTLNTSDYTTAGGGALTRRSPLPLGYQAHIKAAWFLKRRFVVLSERQSQDERGERSLRPPP